MTKQLASYKANFHKTSLRFALSSYWRCSFLTCKCSESTEKKAHSPFRSQHGKKKLWASIKLLKSQKRSYWKDERWNLFFCCSEMFLSQYHLPLRFRLSPTSDSSCTDGSSPKNPWEIEFVIFLSSLPHDLSSKIQTAMQYNSIPWGEHFLRLV